MSNTLGKSPTESNSSLTESRIQQNIVRWYKNNYCLAHSKPRSLILSIPNEGAPRLTQMGALPGASDIIIFHRIAGTPAVRTIFIEVKTPIGRQSPRQKEFEAHVRGMELEYHIIRSVDDLKNIIETMPEC